MIRNHQDETYAITLFFFTSLLVNAYAALVPFENEMLPPAHELAANFTFGAHDIVFCYDNTLQTIGVITWPLDGQRQVSTLPIFLKIKDQIQGSLADPVGLLTIYNNTTITRIISCQFGF